MKRALALLIALLVADVTFAAEGDVLKPRIIDWFSEIIRAISFNSDGTVLAVAPKDNDFWLADPATGKKGLDIKAAQGPTTALFAGPSPEVMYSAEGVVLRLVNLKSGAEVAKYGLSQGPTGTGFVSADGKMFGFGSKSGGIELMTPNLKESLGSVLPKVPPAGPADFNCSAAAISADGKFAAAGRSTGKLFLFTMNGHEQQSDFALSGHSGHIDGVAFTKEGLVSLGRDGKVKWWNPSDGKEAGEHDFQTPLARGWLLANGQVAAIVRKPGAGEIQLHRLPAKAGEAGKMIGTINVADVFDGFPLRTREFEVPHVALAPNGKYLAVAIQAGQIELTNSRVAFYDVGDIMPKMEPPKTSLVNSPNEGPPPKTTPAPIPTKPENEARTWTTADGKFTVEASLVSMANGVVKLKRKDTGKVISVPLKNLSLEDQEYMRSKR